MSGTLPANEPECLDASSSCINLVIDARPRDLGGFEVRRILPSMKRRMVGPFIFFDHMGPAELAPGAGFDVRPHPHIGLSTLTYLFSGEIVHRDSLGSEQPIRPGDVNWMLAGRGIVHSERSSEEARRTGMHLHGIQCWVALPIEAEEDAPFFEHHPGASIPRVTRDGVALDVIAGTAFGQRSPVRVTSPTLYVHALMEAQARLTIDEEHAQRAVYVVEGSISCDAQTFRAGTMIVLREQVHVSIVANERSRIMILGGAPLAEERYIFWNFVSTSKERLEAAKAAWTNGDFPKIPGDDTEFVPLPER